MKALGLDLGTTSLCAVVLETDSGVLAAKTVQNAAFLPGERWSGRRTRRKSMLRRCPSYRSLCVNIPRFAPSASRVRCTASYISTLTAGV